MSKSPSGRKRATQAFSPTGKSETPPTPATPETEPQRVELKSPSGRKRATRAYSATGKSETPPGPAARETEPQGVEASGVPVSFRPRREDRSPSHEQIALHAYHLWLARGQPGGSDWDDWLEAERQLAASA
jgi:Protein of unknown function (DUF2934)